MLPFQRREGWGEPERPSWRNRGEGVRERRIAHPVVAANQGRDRHLFRSRERRIPPARWSIVRTVSPRSNGVHLDFIRPRTPALFGCLWSKSGSLGTTLSFIQSYTQTSTTLPFKPKGAEGGKELTRLAWTSRQACHIY